MDEKVVICGAQLFFTLQQSGQVGETLGSKARESGIKSGPLLSEITHLSTKALCVCAKTMRELEIWYFICFAYPKDANLKGMHLC